MMTTKNGNDPARSESDFLKQILQMNRAKSGNESAKSDLDLTEQRVKMNQQGYILI